MQKEEEVDKDVNSFPCKRGSDLVWSRHFVVSSDKGPTRRPESRKPGETRENVSFHLQLRRQGASQWRKHDASWRQREVATNGGDQVTRHR